MDCFLFGTDANSMHTDFCLLSFFVKALPLRLLMLGSSVAVAVTELLHHTGLFQGRMERGSQEESHHNGEHGVNAGGNELDGTGGDSGPKIAAFQQQGDETFAQVQHQVTAGAGDAA